VSWHVKIRMMSLTKTSYLLLKHSCLKRVCSGLFPNHWLYNSSNNM
jgi:hypothetical protein